MQNLIEVIIDTNYYSSAIYPLNIPLEEFKNKETFGSAGGNNTLRKGDVLEYLGTKTLSHGHNPYSCWLIHKSEDKDTIGKIFQMETYNQSLINTRKLNAELSIILIGSETEKEVIEEYYLSLLEDNNKVTLPYLSSCLRSGAGAYSVTQSLKNRIQETEIIYVKKGYWENMMFDILSTEKDFSDIIAAKYVKKCVHENTFALETGIYWMDSNNIKRALNDFRGDKSAIKKYGFLNCHFKIHLL